MAIARDKDVILINPPYERIAPSYDYVKHLTSRSPSLGLLHLASVLRDGGYRPTLIESDVFDLDENTVAERVIAAAPAHVGITLFTVGVSSSARIAAKIKAALPATSIIVGGPHVSSMGRETLKRFPQFDIAVPGEGEATIVNLLRTLDAKRDLSAVAGIIYRDLGRLRATPPPAISVVLDDLPAPAWDLLPDFPNAYPLAVFDYPAGPVATIAASRGCSFHCTFCDTSTFGARMRFYSPGKVFAMMEHLHSRFGVRHILFVDDLFVASRERVRGLCQLIIDNRLPVTWSCNARVDGVRPDLLALMKEAGCWQISFGLESGSDEILKKMVKHIDTNRAERAIRWTVDAGIRAKGLFILGYPGETGESIKTTYEYILRLPLTIVNLSKFTPYPGSPIYRELYGVNIRDDHWDQMNGMNFFFTPEGFSMEDLAGSYRKIVRGFYTQRRVMSEYIRMSLHHPQHLQRLIRFGGAFLASRTRRWNDGAGDSGRAQQKVSNSCQSA